MCFILSSYVVCYVQSIFFSSLQEKTAKVSDGTLMRPATNNLACSLFSFDVSADCCFHDAGVVQCNDDVKVLAEYGIFWIGILPGHDELCSQFC